MSEKVLNELASFLNSKSVNLKKAAISTVCQLSGTEDGLDFIINKEEFLSSVLKSIQDSEEEIVKQSFKTLVNVSAKENGIEKLISLDPTLIETLICNIQNKNYIYTDLACGVLANITRHAKFCKKVLDSINKSPIRIDGLFVILCEKDYNKKGQNLDLLTSILSNLTQIEEGRREILNKEKDNFWRILSFLDDSGSKIRRKAAIYAIHNCTFAKDYHDWFLSEEIDLSSRLVYPLAGPDVFTLEENESLPLDLQFLDEEKKREEDKELRAVLLESLMQLCTTRKCREHLRNQNIYLILREHHKWEEDQRCLMLNEDIVDLLIKYEQEIGEDDLSAVEVPPDLIQKFENFDVEMLKENKTT